MGSNRKLAAVLAQRYKLPSIAVYGEYVIEGGLISYGPDWLDIFRRSAGYVDRILRGASPAELPVQSPAKYELIVNAKRRRRWAWTCRCRFSPAPTR